MELYHHKRNAQTKTQRDGQTAKRDTAAIGQMGVLLMPW